MRYRLAVVAAGVLLFADPAVSSGCSTGGNEAHRTVTESSELPDVTTLAPGTEVTYNYRVRTVQMRSVPATGSWVWRSQWVDEGSWHWHSDVRDEGYWADSGYWVGGWVTWTTRDWFDTSHWAFAIHNNKFSSSSSPVSCWSHSHHPTDGDCGGHGAGFQYHWNSFPFWHEEGYWGPDYIAGYYEPRHTYVPQRYWQSVLVDQGLWHWHSVMVDRGSWVWQETAPARLEPVVSWTVERAVSTPPPADAYDVTYNYVLLERACALPT